MNDTVYQIIIISFSSVITLLSGISVYFLTNQHKAIQEARKEFKEVIAEIKEEQANLDIEIRKHDLKIQKIETSLQHLTSLQSFTN